MKRIQPGPNQESVWDYPRPPRLEPSSRRIRVILAGSVIADSTRCYRLLETSHPPTWYIPPADVQTTIFIPYQKTSFCEFKGIASYWSLVHPARKALIAAWSYEDPSPPFAAIRGYLGFYANQFDACFVDEEQVQPQPGDFYAGWITSEIVGPFKGGPGTYGW